MLQFPHYIETNTPHESWTGEVTTEHLVSKLQTSVNALEENGWRCESRYPENGLPQRLMWKGSTAIVFKKSRVYYRTRSCFASNRIVASTMQTDSSLFKWHLRFGHLNATALQKVYREQNVIGLDIFLSEQNEQSGDIIDCLSCTLAKSRRMSYRNLHPRRSILCCEKLMSVVCHYGEKSADGNVKFQLVEDEFSRYLWGFLFQHKSQSAGNLETLILQLKQNGRQIHWLHSDNGSEFKNVELKKFMQENGIRPVRTNTYTPEENSLVEKMNGIMLRAIRTLLVTTGLPTNLWEKR
ncbi:LOW QUALITY PROTEIN: hypothetical protein PHMEG_00022582 [Phytophthora megakarya]|uniref:Integrase catalytic domain-containing protein n=1 Tax=Phytophthora megakarya TaxID=4795 RepID=A0A225VKQ0_9STRA|nr:LOW QUALITY PROTEIN: hypothetical protein PHMEG_00022582 [Phytophthora megakarya]